MLALTLSSVVQYAATAPSGWSESNLSTTIAPDMTSIAVDNNGKVHIAIIDYNYGAHVVYADDVSGTWSAPYTIAWSAGTTPAIATDSTGHSYVVYLLQNNSMELATNAGGSWQNTTIYTNPAGPAYSFSLAIDHNDKVHIAFTPYLSNMVKHATNAGGSWTIENVTTGSNVESLPAISIDSNNKVHIACNSYGTRNGLVYHENTTGTWSSTVVNITYTINFVKMVLDKNDKAHIAYMTEWNTIRYATNVDGNWKNTTISSFPVKDSATLDISPPNIVVDSSNVPSISFTNVTGSMEYYMEVAHQSGSNWITTRLGPGLAGSMAVSSTNAYYVTYHGWTGALGSFMIDSTGTITPGMLGGSASGSPPGPLTSVVATAGDGKVTLTWGDPTSGGTATNVIIYRSTTNSQPSAPLTTVAIQPREYQDTTVTNNQTYYYWLVSHNAYGNGAAVATGAVTPTSGDSTSTTAHNNNSLILLLIIILIVVVVLVLLVLRRRRKKQ